MEGRQTEYERTTSLFGTGQVVGITLVVKAHTSEAAERIVRTRLQTLLNEWINEDIGHDAAATPYPPGALLYYRINAR